MSELHFCPYCRGAAKHRVSEIVCDELGNLYDVPVTGGTTVTERLGNGSNKAEFITKDSGKRQEFSTGMKRDVQTDKPRYDLIGSGWDLIRRWAELMGRGAVKYGELNFEKAATEEELRRFKASALRHAIQWFNNETDEDHASAVCFNLAGAEMVREKLYAVKPPKSTWREVKP